MNNKYDYKQYMDIKYDHQEIIDVPKIVEECKDKWYNQTLTKINDSVARIGIVDGEYHWHKHENDDEFFFVLDGKLFVDIENKTFELNKLQGVTISKGILHRTRAPQKTVILMIETASIDPLGNIE